MYILLKKKIERKTYISKEEMQKMLDIYYFSNSINGEEYKELTTILVNQ